MLAMLLELTKNESYGNMNQFSQRYYAGTGVLQDLEIWGVPGFTYYDDGNEVLIHNAHGKVIYSCNYVEYCGIKHITTIYGIGGLVKAYAFDYESEQNRCLYDIWELKNRFPERWIFKLEPIYREYGCDIVNAVRTYAHLLAI